MSMENIDLAGVEVVNPPAQPPSQATKKNAKKNNYFPNILFNKNSADKSSQTKYTINENERSSVSFFTLVSCQLTWEKL